MTGPEQDFRARFQRLRDDHAPGVSLEDLHYAARRRLEERGQEAVSLSTVQKRLAPGSQAGATLGLLVTLAAALDVAPEEFPEYRLALARQELDEGPDGVGLDQALANLEVFNAAKEAQRAPGGAPPIPGETGRRVAARIPKRTGRTQPGSGQGKASS